jgi:hypothetical protein
MTSRKNTISGLLAAVGVTAILAVGAATPSFAAKAHRGYQARAYDARAYDAWGYGARTRADARQRRGGGYFAHGAPDDPPGSAYQSFANDDEMGLVR